MKRDNHKTRNKENQEPPGTKNQEKRKEKEKGEGAGGDSAL